MKISSKSILKISTALLASTIFTNAVFAEGTYGPFPVTLQGYEGSEENTVSYSGQIARHVLHDNLKVLAANGNGGANAEEVLAQMMAYYNGDENGLEVLAPASTDDFGFMQTNTSEISSGANLEGKFYNGSMNAWPGSLTGKDVIVDMMERAALTNGGVDLENGLHYPQLISKFTMGAVSFHQAVDNYLDEKLEADTKPNNEAYSEGAHYTGKEHSWDEAFGYWGAPAHALSLTPEQAYNIAKKADLAVADANGDGVVDMKSEYTFGPAYYAADADKSGKTQYLHTIMTAFIDGRMIIANAAGEALSDDQRTELKAQARIIADNWEKVLAEAAFKYAGSVYNDINKLKEAEDADKADITADYIKHWGELKGFLMALQTGKNNLGETATQMNILTGFGPVLEDGSFVTGVDADGKFNKLQRTSLGDYQINMLKLQQLLADDFGLEARKNDLSDELKNLAEAIEAAEAAETD